MSSSPAHRVTDPVPAFAKAVIALYAHALPGVRFPDLDLSVLEGAADELRAAQVELEQIEAEVAVARKALDAQADRLTQQAQRALAYARVFADTDPTLAARVAEIIRHEEPASAAAPKKRGRPRRGDGDPSLFETNDIAADSGERPGADSLM